MTSFRDLGLRAEFVDALAAQGIDDAVRHPRGHHRRRARRPRRVRQGPHRFRQDARVRPADAADRRPRPSPATPPRSCSCRRASSPSRWSTCSSPLGKTVGIRVAAFYGGTSLDKQVRNLHASASRSRSRTPGRMIDLLERGELDLDQVRHPRDRRGRPHGRHGLPAAGRVDPAQGAERPPDAALLRDARPRGRRARAPLHARPGSPRGRGRHRDASTT